jgi:2-polyprenyl-6-methoxyphenol hydroxylase-like FAD-dependent oxidoreductase
MRTEALIVGAGPVGLSLAIGLRLHGMFVRIVDQRHGPQTEPRAAVIWPRGAEALDDLGVGEAIRQAANELGSLHLYSRARHLGTAQLGRLASAYPKPLLIEQQVTERILAARLAALGTEVEWATTAASVHLGSDDAKVTLRHAAHSREEVVQPAWLIGCDGAHSFVRKALGIDFPGGPAANLQVLQVDAVPRWRFPAHNSEGHYFLARGACLGCFPVADGAYRFFCYTHDPDPNLQQPPTAAEMRELIAGLAGTPELRLNKVSWLNRARFQTRFATQLRLGRALLVGDAAHVWPSLGGHGMNIGVQGAYNLAWKLAAVQRGRASELLLDTYEAEVRATVARFLRLMPLNLVERPSRLGGLLPRELALWLGLKLPGVSHIIERAASDLTVDHRHSPLSQGQARQLSRRGSRTNLISGDRVPNAAVRLPADGRSTRMHALLSYQRWTLVLPAGLPERVHAQIVHALAPWRGGLQTVSVVEEADPAAMRLGLGCAQLILVRPDRHIGLVAHLNELARVCGYLEHWLGRAEEQGEVSCADETDVLAEASCAA